MFIAVLDVSSAEGLIIVYYLWRSYLRTAYSHCASETEAEHSRRNSVSAALGVALGSREAGPPSSTLRRRRPGPLSSPRADILTRNVALRRCSKQARFVWCRFGAGRRRRATAENAGRRRRRTKLSARWANVLGGAHLIPILQRKAWAASTARCSGAWRSSSPTAHARTTADTPPSGVFHGRPRLAAKAEGLGGRRQPQRARTQMSRAFRLVGLSRSWTTIAGRPARRAVIGVRKRIDFCPVTRPALGPGSGVGGQAQDLLPRS